MDSEAYIKVLRTHGRRVANRVALAFINETHGPKELNDFYACYAPESDLPESERCKTGLIDKFDPTGWTDHYRSPINSEWPEPKTEIESDTQNVQSPGTT